MPGIDVISLNKQLKELWKLPAAVNVLNQIILPTEEMRRMISTMALPTEAIKQMQTAMELPTEEIKRLHSAMEQFNKISSLLNFQTFFDEFISLSMVEAELWSDKDFEKLPLIYRPNISSADIRKIAENWKHPLLRKQMKEVLLSEMRKPEILQIIKNELVDDPSFGKRSHILEEIIWAHLKGKYYLSIPVSFMVIDGIMIERFGLLFKESKCDCCEACRKKDYPSTHTIAEKLVKIFRKSKLPYKTQYIAQLASLISRFATERNPILHGKVLNYGDEEVSAGLLLTMSALNFPEISIDGN
ncbi:MAG: hypothetical protein AABX01_00145 [Candidatus Micrarchaeota archaeon]